MELVALKVNGELTPTQKICPGDIITLSAVLQAEPLDLVTGGIVHFSIIFMYRNWSDSTWQYNPFSGFVTFNYFITQREFEIQYRVPSTAENWLVVTAGLGTEVPTTSFLDSVYVPVHVKTPNVTIIQTATSGTSPLTVTFAVASPHQDAISSIRWYVGRSGTTLQYKDTGFTFTHTFTTSSATPEVYSVRADVISKCGTVTSYMNSVTVNAAPATPATGCTNPTGAHGTIRCIGTTRSECVNGTWVTLQTNAPNCIDTSGGAGTGEGGLLNSADNTILIIGVAGVVAALGVGLIIGRIARK